jgi:outer membrane lipoprotein-sorting protein
MTDTRLWDRAASLPVPVNGARRPEVVALAADLPTVAELFTFMRDAELRFETLRMRIKERTFTARGEQLVVMEVAIRHPGDARVTMSDPERGTAGNYEVWISDGVTVRTYSAPNKLGTERPVRHTVRGVNEPDFPGMSHVYYPVTPLPMETLAETFVHPGGYCQNVLGTGRTWISGTDEINDREVIVVECDHPRTIELAADRPDFHIQLAVDRADGVILRLVETIGGEVTREADVVAYDPNAALQHSTFEFEFPTGTTKLF